MSEGNMSEGNAQKLASMNMADNLKYSTINIYIKEPQLRIAEIAVTNTTSIDNKYRYNFIYDTKDGFVYGFYLIQRIIVALINIWPILLIAAAIIYFLRKRKVPKPEHSKIQE